MCLENGDVIKSEDNDTDTESDDNNGSRFYVYYITCVATMGGLLFGYDTGIISGSMLIIGTHFKLSTIWKELIVSATVGAAAIFALIAGNLTDWIGRKKVVMFASILFTAGAIIMALAPDKYVLICGRFVSGIGLERQVPIESAKKSLGHGQVDNTIHCTSNSAIRIRCLVAEGHTLPRKFDNSVVNNTLSIPNGNISVYWQRKYFDKAYSIGKPVNVISEKVETA